MTKVFKYAMIGAVALLGTVAQADDKKSNAATKQKSAQAEAAAAADSKIELTVKGMT